ncbi:radical SAM protein [Rhodospirillum centenum]|uniref:Radical SAM domain protein n=1 Tax=Rhodospirillum centenum (strain ATCC 51521 / SW) TaxID=414684 RepID=B6IYC1_RHOCS|nr:radical SAM protein [Rhodospirillum centenum]ACJ01295.1 radical SAM domain protein [Rhodospirillum centenum SW]
MTASAAPSCPTVATTPLDPAKFRDPAVTARGERRAWVTLAALRTLWLNTGTLCNIACANCYIESSPRNDALVYLARAEAKAYLDEIAAAGWPTREIGLTGGEPFMNRDVPGILEDILDGGFRALVLTNAMRPMQRHRAALLRLRDRHGARLSLRVSLDHYGRAVHEAERGPGSWEPALRGLVWLATNGFDVSVAGRDLPGEGEDRLRAGYARLFADLGLGIDAADPARLVLFPEMDARRDVPEITEACWGILGRSPDQMMCAGSRMVVKRKGTDRPTVVACTLLPYDPRFDLGPTLAGAHGPVALNHPHCARFCVLGGASCSAG